MGDSALALRFQRMVVSGTFVMGSAACPIREAVTVTVPGGDASYGIEVARGATYDVHGTVQVGRSKINRTVGK